MSEEHPAGLEGKTILLVDDEPCLLKLLKEVLEKNGYTVLPADTPMKALQLAELHRERIDLLLTDVVMPEMDGCELSR
ncbi:MAG: response regulator [Chlorobiaceae bacterium]